MRCPSCGLLLGTLWSLTWHLVPFSENGPPLTRSLVTDRLRAILLSAGLPGDFSSHSFRIGAATSAASAGVPDRLIQVLDWWKSNAYKQYIRTPPDLITPAAKSLVE